MSNPQQTSSEDELAAEDKVEFQLTLQVDPDLIKNFPADVARDFGVLPWADSVRRVWCWQPMRSCRRDG